MINFKKYLIKAVGLTTLSVVVASSLYVYAEPESVRALAVTDEVIITLEVTTGISITSPADTTMSTNLGISSNVAVATTTWNIKTNNSLGYTLGVRAGTNPAMKSSTDYIEDYASTTNPSTWSVASGQAKFGFSVFGTDVNTTKWGTGSFCNGAGTSTVSSTLKYSGFFTTATTTAIRSSTTTPSGVNTTVCYAVEQNGAYIPSGAYSATITATATTL